jgi:hypothetical protein
LQAGALNATALTDSKVKDESMEKLGPGLRVLLEGDDGGAAPLLTVAGLAQTRDAGMVQVYIYFEALGDAIEPTLAEMGVALEVINYDLGIIQGWVSADRLQELSELPFVGYVDVPDYGVTRAGSVTSEAVSILRADDLHAQGVTGQGIRVGVISAGADNISDAQLTNDLPASVSVFGTCSFATTVCNEGTAMLEIIHDMAPDAQLGFCASATSLEFINCVQTLQSSFGADIIVDDLGFFREPYFEDGSVAQAVANVASTRIYVSATGNDAEEYYEAQFQTTIPSFTGREVHNFGAAAGGLDFPANTLQLSAGEQVVVHLQWNDPFGASSNDYDMLLTNEDFTLTLATADLVQDGNDNPQEQLIYRNTGDSTITVQLVVVKFAGEGRRIKMFVFGPSAQYVTPRGSVFGHPAVTSVVAAGAIRASDPGLDTIESFSSQGPVFIAFPVQEQRPKPDLTAIDGVSVTGAGGFSTTFFGTSAAAPHVAGIAALLKSADSQPSRDTVINAMKSSAVDLGAPGRDDIYGAGRVDALAAFNALSSSSGGGGGDSGGGGCMLSSPSGEFDPLLPALFLVAVLYLSCRRFQG